MSRMYTAFFAVIMSASIAACGDDTPSTPTAPSTPTVNSMTITGNDAIRTGFFANYVATASLSNGTTQTVTPTWTSSNPRIAAVDATGRLDGNAHGSVNLAASYQGLTASKNVNVVQNYGGNWRGTYVIRACDQSGAFSQVRWCQNLGGVGAILPFLLDLTQAGNTRDQITGTISLGTLAGNTSGNVTGDGRLVIGGPYNVTSSGLTFTITIGGWDTQAAAGDSMTGGWAQNMLAIGVAGNAYQENRIIAVNHTSQQVTASSAPDSYSISLDELFARLRGN